MAQDDQKPNLLQVFGSVLASFIGVQSQKNRERDFTKGKLSHYIIAGIIMTAAFIVIVWTVVQFVLRSAGVT